MAAAASSPDLVLAVAIATADPGSDYGDGDVPSVGDDELDGGSL